jgi:hypothetical protein
MFARGAWARSIPVVRAGYAVAVVAGLAIACGSRTPLDILGDTPIDGNDAASPADSGPAIARPDVIVDSPSTSEPKDAPTDVPFDVSCGNCARLLVVDFSNFYELKVPEGTLKPLGKLDRIYGDVAFSNDKQTIYGSDTGQIRTVSPELGTWESTFLVPITNPRDLVGLEVGPDGILYGAQDTIVVRIDPHTGIETPLATFPTGYVASGDLGFANGRMFASAAVRAGAQDDLLVEIDPVTGTMRSIGPIGTSCVLGLGGVNDTLYGVTCEGNLYAIDLATGAGTLLAKLGDHYFFGASPW